MNFRAFLLAAVLTSPAWAEEPAAVPSFDLRGDAVQRAVRDSAASQAAYVQVSEKAPVKPEHAEFVYVPPEKAPAPPRETPRRPSEPSSRSHTFLSAMLETLVEEALGIDDYDDLTASNDMLRCRVQKDLNTSPPGVDNCPNVY